MIDLQHMYEEKLPPQFKQLEEIDDENENDKDKNFDWEQSQPNFAKKKKQFEEKFPEEFSDYKKILQLQVDQFISENEKSKQKQQREQQNLNSFTKNYFGS